MSNNFYGYSQPYQASVPQHSSQSSRDAHLNQTSSAGANYYGQQSTASYTPIDYSSNPYAQQRPPSGSHATESSPWYAQSSTDGRMGGTSDTQTQRNANVATQPSTSDSRMGTANQYDTTGLGNLAYASSLDYASSQDIGTSRAQTSPNYPNPYARTGSTSTESMNRHTSYQNSPTISVCSLSMLEKNPLTCLQDGHASESASHSDSGLFDCTNPAWQYDLFSPKSVHDCTAFSGGREIQLF